MRLAKAGLLVLVMTTVLLMVAYYWMEPEGLISQATHRANLQKFSPTISKPPRAIKLTVKNPWSENGESKIRSWLPGAQSCWEYAAQVLTQNHRVAVDFAARHCAGARENDWAKESSAAWARSVVNSVENSATAALTCPENSEWIEMDSLPSVDKCYQDILGKSRHSKLVDKRPLRLRHIRCSLHQQCKRTKQLLAANNNFRLLIVGDSTLSQFKAALDCDLAQSGCVLTSKPKVVQGALAVTTHAVRCEERSAEIGFLTLGNWNVLVRQNWDVADVGKVLDRYTHVLINFGHHGYGAVGADKFLTLILERPFLKVAWFEMTVPHFGGNGEFPGNKDMSPPMTICLPLTGLTGLFIYKFHLLNYLIVNQ